MFPLRPPLSPSLDTAFVLDLLDGDDGAAAKAEELAADGVVLKMPTVTVLELYIGIGTAVAAAVLAHHVLATRRNARGG